MLRGHAGTYAALPGSPPFKVPEEAGLGWSPKIYISHQFPGHVAVTGPRNTESCLTTKISPLPLFQLGRLCPAQPVRKGWTPGIGRLL